jgi:hypothetical protein
MTQIDPALRRRQVHGLLWAATILLLAGVGRAAWHEGWQSLLPPGWWRIW